MNILALNAGSSTLKYQVLEMPGGKMLSRGTVEHVGGESIVPAAEKAIDEARAHGVDAIGHRVVHGGHEFREPVVVTREVVDRLRGLEDLDPTHNPAQVHMIEAALRLAPSTPSVAVFDTAFHRTIPDVAALYALPWNLTERLHLRRYGFHGLSHQYVSQELFRLMGVPAEGSRVITCHLGNGASVCAIRDGKSVDTSMGLTPLEGLVMGTRSGDVDPGLLLYLLRGDGMTPAALDYLLNEKSGLAGVSGRSADVRDLEAGAANGEARCELALSMFAYRVRKYIGAYTAAMGGVDAVVFTGGIGEHSAAMRARICDGLEFLGADIDPNRNAETRTDSRRLSTDASAVQLWVIPTNEELELAREIARMNIRKTSAS